MLMRLLAYTILICCCLPALGEQVYRLPDENGVPAFSDSARPGAEIVTLGTTMTYPALPIAAESADNPAASKNTESENSPLPDLPEYSLEVTTDNKVVRDSAGRLLLQVNIEPELVKGHRAELLNGSKRLLSIAGTGPVQLTNLDRGDHSFNIRVLDGRGKPLAQSTNLPITLLRHSRLYR